jgi:hypothetical protein
MDRAPSRIFANYWSSLARESDARIACKQASYTDQQTAWLSMREGGVHRMETASAIRQR